MDFWRSLSGMLEVELTSANISDALDEIKDCEIILNKVYLIDELTAVFSIKRSQLLSLTEVAERRGETIQIRNRKGLYWWLRGLVGRPLVLIGLFLFVILVFYLPTRVLFIQVEGNVGVPVNRILEAAQQSGIRFGASRRAVRSEKVKNALLDMVPELQWAGVNTHGCSAMISVRERSAEDIESEKKDVSSIVATRDGYVISATATQGNLLCHPGQSVKEGQVLISGYTDCGIYIQATRAEGEVFAQTNRDITVISCVNCLKKTAAKETKRKISMIIGKKRVKLWKDSGIWDATCGRMYEEYYIALPGGFQLPVAVCVETYTLCEMETTQMDGTAMERALEDYARSYLNAQMAAGSILAGSYSMVQEDAVVQLGGNFVCVEMIGRVQQEQMGDTNGKSS